LKSNASLKLIDSKLLSDSTKINEFVLGNTFIEEIKDFYNFVDRLEKYNNTFDSTTIAFYFEPKVGENL